MNRFAIISLLFILASCAAKKQVAEFEAQPTWMKSKPVESGYYIGVGSAKKVGTVQEYSENAKRDALTNLAQEISVKISATSVLHTIETETGFDENFDQIIRISTDDYLEGFEPVDFYENESSYWVYYRISKATYVEKKELKKQQALEAAKLKYLAGTKEEQHNAREAITFYLQGLQSLYNYLGEETQMEINGTSIDLGNELYSALSKMVSDLKIEAQSKQVSVQRGKSIETPLVFKTFYKSKIEQGLPVSFKYSGGYLNKDHGFSNENGVVEIQPGIIQSQNTREKIAASINLNEIAQKAVDNLFIRGILTKQTIEPAVAEIFISKPNLLFVIPDHYCNNEPCEKIREIFNEIALSKGYNISAKNEIAYTFIVKFNSNKGERAGGLFAAYVSGELTLQNENNEQLWSKTVQKIKGVGHSEMDAKDKAFEDFATDLKRIYFPQAFDQIK